MRARLATFQVGDPAKVGAEIATTRRFLAGGKRPEGIPPIGLPKERPASAGLSEPAATLLHFGSTSLCTRSDHRGVSNQ